MGVWLCMIKEYSFKGHPYKIECSDVHASWWTHEDEHEVRMRQWDIQPGEVVLDIGAAYGSYSLIALALGAEYVFAWSPQGPPGQEPERVLFEKSLLLNGWQDKAIVYNSGLYNQTGWLNVDTQQMVEPQEHPSVIKVETLDGWTSRVDPNKVDWLKLDVEGAEVEVLKSGIETIKKFKPKIQIENHLFVRNTIAEEIRDLLLPLGYIEIENVPYHSVSHSLFHPGGV